MIKGQQDTWFFDCVVTWHFVKYENCLIDTFTRTFGTKLDRMVIYGDCVSSAKSQDPLIVCSRDSENSFINMQYFHKAHGHNTREGIGLWWGATNCKVTLLLGHVVIWGHVTSKLLYQHFSMVFWDQTWKIGNLLVTYGEGSSSKKSHDPLVTWSHDIT